MFQVLVYLSPVNIECDPASQFMCAKCVIIQCVRGSVWREEWR